MTGHSSNRALAAREWAARLREWAQVMVCRTDPFANQDMLSCADFLDEIAKDITQSRCDDG